METCLHIDAPLFPSIIDPADPTELQRRWQAVSQSTARRTVSTQVGAGRAGSRSRCFSIALRLDGRDSIQWGVSPRLQTLQQLPRGPNVNLSTAICVHIYIQISIVGVSM